MDHPDSNNNKEANSRPPSPPHPQGPHGIVERFLANLFDSRFLVGPASSTPPPPPPPPPPSSNSPLPRRPDRSTHAPLPSSTSSPAPPMQSAPHVVFCVEDTVGLKDVRNSVGVVDRAFGDVETHQPRPQRDYNDDIACHPDISEQEFAKFLKSGIPPRGSVLISWQTEVKTELIPEARLELLDRALFVGDVVKRTADEHMSGTVIGTRTVCSLFPATHNNGGQITQAATDDLSIHNVPSDEVLNIHEYNEGDIVIYGYWVGRIENVYDEVAVKLGNNSVVVVEDPNELEQEHVSVDRLSVGDSVTTKKGNLRRGLWKYGAFDPNVRPEGIIVETRTVEIDVQWLARRPNLPPDSGSAEEPPVTLGRDEFESPNFYRYDATGSSANTLPLASDGSGPCYHVADLAVGDRVRFKDLAGAAVKYDRTHTLPDGTPQGKLSRIPRTETLGYDLNVFLVMQTHTRVTVQWQDLSITEDRSCALIPDPNVDDDDEVWPGEVVFSKEECQRDPTGNNDWTKKPAKVGVVQAVKSRDRIAQVRWFTNPSIEFFGPDLLQPCRTGELNKEAEDVSLYDIYSFPAVTRRRNDFVLIHPGAIENLHDRSHITGPNWFGEVIDLGLDGKLTVRLGAAEPVTEVRVPYEAVTLAYSSDLEDEYLNMDDIDESLEDSDESIASDDWDSASFNEMWYEYEAMEGEHPIGNEEDWSTEDEDSSDDDTSMPDLEDIDDTDTSKTTPETKSPVAKSNQVTEAVDEAPDGAPAPQAESSEASPGSPSPFLILDTPVPSNHYYFRDTTEATSSTLMRRISKEHKILRGALPSGIFVRTWESRLDLLRVLILGPADTPYEFAPFIIDFRLPTEYPVVAPEAYFHSWTNGQGAVNPNLYEDGKICLSLLGTWHTDERNESWSPTKSTLLQVLVSIMGLVLVKEPYYNEAGYDVHKETPETKLASALYTERAYFRARAFIHHALTNDVEPFKQELEYLYRSTEEGAPRLLDQAIQAAKDVIERSASNTEEGQRDGLRTISLGAVVMLKRQVEKLEGLRTP